MARFLRESRVVLLLSNGLSIFGALVAGVTLAIILFLVAVELLTGEPNPYTGMLIYAVLPPFIMIGLLVIPIGMYLKWRRLARTGEDAAPRWPRADFNDPGTRRVALFVVGGGLLYLAVSAIGSYQAFHYSETVTFCGMTCHSVMEPEHTAYQNSPHARVTCVQCHVGSGADWFVKSKISGAYQIYAVLANVYPRPIPTPIENLRPAQDTCEQCHWPKMFFGAQQRQYNHYMYDRENTHWATNLLIRTGGGDPKTGRTAGIHWHMNISSQVEYIATDERRQDIPWVRVTDRETGTVTVYQSETDPLTEEEIAAAMPRTMDCIDCHNRPSHIFHSPDWSIDLAMRTGRIAQDLPYIKRTAVAAMAAGYETKEDAMRGIATAITDFYRESHREVYATRRADIDKAILETQQEYRNNIFPYMKVDWSKYPNNIGHFYDKGCMRCHEGDHAAKDGSRITHACDACHVILSQGGEDEGGEGGQVVSVDTGLEFEHPEDIGGEWEFTGCWECHDGTRP